MTAVPSQLGRTARIRLLSATLVLTLCIWSAGARSDNGKRPRLFLIVCDALTLEDLDLAGSAYPQLSYLAAHGTLGLMNCAVAGPRSDTAALMAIAAGQQAPAEKTDEQAANDWEKAPGERISAAESHRRRLSLPAKPAYAFDPRRSVKHLGIQQLRVRGLDTGRLGAALASASPPAPTAGWRRRAALLTVDKLGVGSGMVALRSYDPRLPYGLTDSPPALVEYAWQTDADFVVIHLGDGARAEAARQHLSEAEYREAHRHAVRVLNALVSLLRNRLKPGSADILVVSPRPPAADAAHPEVWNELTPILGYGPDFPPGAFASTTTRTPGLVSNTDIAPTILSLYRLPTPPTMIGRPMRIIPDEREDAHGSRRIKRIVRLNFIAWANAAALAPILAVLGAFCFVCVIAGMLSLRIGSRTMAGMFATCIVAAMNFPAAQLFAPIFVTRTVVEYGMRLGAWMLALTVVTYGLARLLRVSLPTAACALNLTAVLADLVTGQHLLKDALISNYYLPGFRYYGLGNDYLGLLLGFAIVGAFSLIDDIEQRSLSVPRLLEPDPIEMRPYRLPDRLAPAIPSSPDPLSPDSLTRTGRLVGRGGEGAHHSEGLSSYPESAVDNGHSAIVDRLAPGLLLGWAAIAFIMGWPAWGANAGSVIVTSAVFGVGWRILRGGKWVWLAALGFTLVGIGLSFAFAYLDARLHGTESSHAGAVLRAAGAGRGAEYLWTIIERKLRFNISLFAAPWTWVTASLIAGVLLLASMIAEEEIEETKRRRFWLARSSGVVFVAALASLLFKDSGVVTVCYLVASVLLVGFYYLLVPTPPAWLRRRIERN